MAGRIRCALALSALCLFAACSSGPRSLLVRPEMAAPARPVNVAGLPLALKVNDARTTQVIGKRRSSDPDTALISTDPDLPVVLSQRLADALKKQGFRTDLLEVAQPRLLAVELQSLQFTPASNWFTGKAKIAAVLRATATYRDAGLEKTYTVSNEKWFPYPSGDAQVESMVNEAFARGLERIVSDQELLGILTR